MLLMYTYAIILMVAANSNECMIILRPFKQLGHICLVMVYVVRQILYV